MIRLNENQYYEGSFEDFMELFRQRLGGLTSEEEAKLREKLRREFLLQDASKKQMVHV